MDETLKRRLVGAAVIALIAIVIVPMLLDGPDWQQADDEPKVTTSRNAEGERVVSVSLNGAVPEVAPASQPTNRAAGTSLTANGVPINRVPIGGSNSSSSESSRDSQASNSQNFNRQASSSVRSSSRPTASAGRDPVISASGSNNNRTGNTASERPASPRVQSQNVTRSPEPASSSRSGWVVQLATFASEENANRLVDKLQAGGWSAWIEPMTSRTGRRLQQVRVGPERSQARANSSAEKLASKYKLKPQVLELR